MIINMKRFKKKTTNAQALRSPSHRSWMRLGSLLVLTSYINQIAYQFLIIGGLSLACPSSLRAMDPPDDRNAGGFYKDAKHPLTQGFWKEKDLSNRLKTIEKDIKNRREEIINQKTNAITLNEKDLDHYKNILKCTEADLIPVQELQNIKYDDLLISTDPAKKNTSGWSGAEVVVLPFTNHTPKIAIKKFKDEDIKAGLEELLYSLIALDSNPAPEEIKMARIYDAVFCSKGSENCLSIIMEGANSHDIDHFLSENSSTNVIKACAEYLAMFHIRNHQAIAKDINKNKHIAHISRFFNTLFRNPFKEEEKDFSLLSLSIGKALSDLEEVKSNNIIRLLSLEKQKQFARFVKESCKQFEKNAGKIYRSRNTEQKGSYFLTKTHGDAHGNNFFYDDAILVQDGPDIPKDSFRRITMIDFASAIWTFGNIGDPAEDAGRFLASLWDWAAQQKYTESEGYKKIHDFQDQFLESYFQKIKEENTIEEINQKDFEKIFKENSNFYKLRYYKVIFNAKKDNNLVRDREIKLRILNAWIEENFENSKNQAWQPVADEDDVLGYLPDRPEGFIESAAEGSSKSYLARLQETLRHAGTATLSSNVTLAGMGGIGKSSLALEYAHKNKKEYKLVYWLLSETEASLLKGYRDLLLTIDVPITGKDDDAIIALVKQKVPAIGKCLLIYDNVPNANFLDDKIPQKNTDILITSRHSQGWRNQPLCLDIFRVEDSINYLLTTTGLEPINNNKAKAGNLAQALGHLPLALSHAASYINVSGRTFEAYLEDFKKDPTSHFEEHRSLRELDMTYENLIGKTLRLSRTLVSEFAKKLLGYCSYLDPDAIAEDIFLEYFGNKKEAFQEALTQLSSLSLIKRAPDKPLFSIHRLAQDVVRNEQRSVGREQKIVPKICNIFNNLFKNNIYFDYQIDNLVNYLPHILGLLDHSKSLKAFCQEVEALEWVGKILYLIGKDTAREKTSKLPQEAKLLKHHEEKNKKKLEQILKKAKKLFKDSEKADDFPDWVIQIPEASHPKIQNILGVMYDESLFVNKDYKKAVLWYTFAAEQGNASAQNNLGIMYDNGAGVEQSDGKALTCYLMAATQGDANAQYALGRICKNGQGVDQNYPEAFNWYKKAAEQGNAAAQWGLGTMYEQGHGVIQNYSKAFNWYKKAAEQGFVRAQYNLGVMYTNGQGVSQDYTEAFKWYLMAATEGFADAQHNLGVMYENSLGVAQSKDDAFFWYLMAAEQGHADSQFNIGIMYDKGQGVDQDYEQAFKWFSKAAEQGDASAQNNVGWMYENGQGVYQNYPEAFNWFKKAAKQGDASAQYNLAWLYDNGHGIVQSDAEALKWYLKAAEQGHAKAQNALGVIFFNGQGIDQDYVKAFQWHIKASEQGYAPAQYNRGLMYERGQGVEQNHIKAFQWYFKAAEQGYAKAQFNVGKMYANGQGIDRDDFEAFRWFTKAAEQGYGDAQALLDWLKFQP